MSEHALMPECLEVFEKEGILDDARMLRVKVRQDET